MNDGFQVSTPSYMYVYRITRYNEDDHRRGYWFFNENSRTLNSARSNKIADVSTTSIGGNQISSGLP